MSGNHSRYSHQRSKLYSAVSLLQGSMVTDADQREAQSVAARSGRITSDMALASGVPEKSGVLEYEFIGGPPDVVSTRSLKPGRVVADGKWGIVRLENAQTLNAAVPLDLLAKQADFLAGAAVPDDARYLVFADVWDRHVGPAEDGRLLDSAFLGAETSVRKARMAQMKLVKTDSFSQRDRDIVQSELPIFGGLRLKDAVLTAPLAPKDDCDPCAATVPAETGTQNHLFRIEIHQSQFARPQVDGGDVFIDKTGDTILVKFSKDNGSIEIAGAHFKQLTSDTEFNDKVFEIATLTSEQQLGVPSNPDQPRTAQLLSMTQLKQKSANDLKDTIIRVWDGAVTLDLSANNLNPEPVGSGQYQGTASRAGSTFTMELSVADLKLRFEADISGGNMPFILPGDAWAVDMREFADATDTHLRFEAEPVEAEHHYTYLGQVAGKKFVPENEMSDMRSRAFPALGDLKAQQVAWSNDNHTTIKTNTVQGALDILFGQEGGDCLCTFCINSSTKLHEQLEQIREKLTAMHTEKPDQKLNAALICFPRGVFALEQSVDFKGLGFVTLRGAGREATEIRMLESATLTVSTCDGFAVDDLSMFSADKKGTALLAVKSTETVDISRAMFSAAPGPDAKNVAFPLVQIEQDIADGDTAVWVTASIFNVLENRIGLTIAGHGMHTVRDCQFNGIPPYYSKRIIGLIPKVFGAVKYVAKPQGVPFGKESGIFELQGAGNNALDLSAFPMAERNEIFDFIKGNKSVFGASDLNTAAKWKTFTDNVEGGTAEVLKQRVTVTPVQPIGRGGGAVIGGGAVRGGGAGGGAGVTRGFVIGNGGAVLGGATGATTGRTGAMLSGTGRITRNSNFAVLMDTITPADPRITGVVANLGAADKQKIGNLLEVLATRTSVASYQRNFGLVIDAGALACTNVVSNHFEWIHSAVIVKGANEASEGAHVPLTAALSIKDNRIKRAALLGISGAAFSGDIYPAAITCDDVGYLKLENNLVQQSFGDTSGIKDYLEYLSDLSETYEGKFAIELRGAVGPVVHAVGNDAVYFTHAIGVTGAIAYQANPMQEATRRQNIWMFRENTVLPCTQAQITALFFAPGLDKYTSTRFVRDAWETDDFNHPPMK